MAQLPTVLDQVDMSLVHLIRFEHAQEEVVGIVGARSRADEADSQGDALYLFERFTRADTARSRGAGNTGLGLAIAFGIVSAHGGTLTVESRAGDTTFRIRLPAAPSPG